MNKTVLSSKGQVVLPVEIRERAKWLPGLVFAVELTPEGALLIPMPKDPVKALIGMTKGMGVKSSDIKRMRQEDDRLAFKNL